MAPVPYMQFQSYNPVDTALSAALRTYEGINTGRQQKIQNELNSAKIPYAVQKEQEALLASQLQNQQSQYNVQKSGAEAPYYGAMAESAYMKARSDAERAALEVQMYPTSEQARINLQIAQANLASTEGQKNQYLLDNPGLMGGPQSKEMTALMLMLEKMKGQNGQAPSQGQIMVEPVGGMGLEPTAQSSQGMPSPQDYLNPSRGMRQETGGMTNYQGEFERAIANQFERIGMQPWEIEAEKRKAMYEERARPELVSKLATDAEASSSALTSLDRAKTAFSDLGPKEKGWVWGHSPRRSAAANTLDQSLKTMAAQLLPLMKGGNISDKDIQFLQDQFPKATMTDEGFNEIVNSTEALLKRSQQKVNFMNQGLDQGLSTEEVNRAWVKYINENPLYISKRERLEELRAKRGGSQ